MHTNKYGSYSIVLKGLFEQIIFFDFYENIFCRVKYAIVAFFVGQLVVNINVSKISCYVGNDVS